MYELYYRLVTRGLRTIESIKDPNIREQIKKRIEAENPTTENTKVGG